MGEGTNKPFMYKLKGYKAYSNIALSFVRIAFFGTAAKVTTGL